MIQIKYLKPIISTLILSIALFVGILFSGNVTFSAAAAPVTPETAQYEIDRSHSPAQAGEAIKNRAQNYKQELDQEANYTKKGARIAADKTGNKLEEIADTVREKLNLDEPLPQSTKDFLGDVKEGFDDAVSPVTGGNTGSYADR